MRPILLPALLAFTAAAQAGETLNAEEFERLAAGKTLHFTDGGAPYGSEQFLSGRRSLWRYAGDAVCASGSWHGDGAAICFRYDGMTEDICWRITREGETVFAEPLGVEGGGRLQLDNIDDAPLPCPQTGAGT